MKINIIMKGIYCLFVVAAVAALCGCSSSEESAGPVQKRILLNASIAKVEELESSEAVQSGKEHFTQGDSFTLVVANAEGQYDPFDFTVGATQLLWKEVTVAGEGAKVNFSACYPVQRLADGKFTFDLGTASEQDLLLAAPRAVTVDDETPVNLTFRHAMHRLNVVFTVDADARVDAETIRTVCTARSKCGVNLLDGSLDTTDPTTADFTRTGGEVSFLVVPQQASDVTLDVTAGDISKSFTVGSLKPGLGELKSGMQLRVEITVKEQAIEIGSITIEGWEDQGSIGGEIII